VKPKLLPAKNHRTDQREDVILIQKRLTDPGVALKGAQGELKNLYDKGVYLMKEMKSGEYMSERIRLEKRLNA